jgi:hypothetical protein
LFYAVRPVVSPPISWNTSLNIWLVMLVLVLRMC